MLALNNRLEGNNQNRTRFARAEEPTETTEELTRKIEARNRLRKLYEKNESTGYLLRLYYKLTKQI